MAGGYHSIIPPLRLGGSVVAGFRLPIPFIGYGATTPTGADGGFVTPVPFLRLGGGLAVQQGGFTSPLPLMGFLGGSTSAQQSDYTTRRMFFRGLSNR